jgi:ABC-type antimicrobial peptide transport system permease subunit
MVDKLKPNALGFSLALLGSLCMLALGILGNLGIYLGAVEMMQKWHLFFSLSMGGIIAGIIEAALISFIAGWLIAYFYNKFN